MLSLRRPQPRLRGFTVLEISTALALVALFSLIAFPTWRAVERAADNRTARLTLISLEPEVARVIIAADGDVPDDIAARMRVGGLDLTDGNGASSDANTVSVAPLSGSSDRAVLTVLAESGACWVMSTTIDTAPRWAVDDSPGVGACRASEPSIDAASVTGTEDSPSQLDLTAAWIPPEPPATTTTTVPEEETTTTSTTTTTTIPKNPAYAAVVLADSPAGYWRLGDSAGGAADSSGAGRHGAYTNVTLGAPGALTGSSDTAATFGSQPNSGVTVSGDTVFSGAEFSAEAWIKTTSPSPASEGIISNEVGAKGAVLYMSGGRVHAYYSRYLGVRADTVSSPTTLNDGNYHHVVYTVNSAGGKLYVDGVHVATSGWLGTPDTHNSTHPLRIGNYQGTHPFNGTIDEAAVYDTVLNPTRIAAHYNAGLDTFVETDPGAATAPVPYAAEVLTDSPLGYWRFDDTSGSTATDSSGYGRHAALSGSYNRGHSGVPGTQGTSYSFNGGFGTQSGAPASVITSATNITIECWVYVPVGDSAGACAKFGSANGFALGIGTGFTAASGRVSALFENIRWITDVAPYTYGWNHLTLVIDTSGKPTVYVNGAAVYTDASTNALAPNGIGSGGVGGYSLVAGGTTYDRTFKDLNVRVDEVAVYATALGPERITAHYQAGIAGMLATPAAPTVTSKTNSSVSLSWSPPAGGATGYRVYRNTSTTPVYTGSATTFTDTGRASATTYTYRVVAYNASGDSRTSAGTVATTN